LIRHIFALWCFLAGLCTQFAHAEEVLLPYFYNGPERRFSLAAGYVNNELIGNNDITVLHGSFSNKGDYSVQFLWDTLPERGARGVFMSSYLEHTNDTTSYFYGLGPGTSDDDKSNYTDNLLDGRFTIGAYLFPRFGVAIRLRGVYHSISSGGLSDVPDIFTLYPTVPGIGGGFSFSYRGYLFYDSRDHVLWPRSGVFAEIFLERSDGTAGTKYRYEKYGAEARWYFSNRDKTFTWALRAFGNQTSGSNLPFWERSSLGGPEALRASPRQRYIDNNLILVSLEPRFKIIDFKQSPVFKRLEGGLFVDGGRVFQENQLLTLSDWQIHYGFGVRLVTAPGATFRLDVAWSQWGRSDYFLTFGQSF
jgi:outer membrane protein assembly factor BamA